MGRLRARHWLAVILALGLIVVAWGFGPGSGGPGDNETLTSHSTAVAGEDEPDRLGLTEDGAADEAAGSSAGSGDEAGAGTGSESSAGPVGPFTGLPIDADIVDRPALVVKIDNHPQARPQTGLDQADIVFDYRAEGITRFAALFHSQTPDPVGPVRSSRTSDFDILRGLDTPLYASSGANDFVAAGLRSLPIVELTNRTRNEYFRDFSRPAPHNLYVNASDLYALAPDESDPPEPWFRYRGPSDPVTAAEAIGPVTVSFTGSPRVTHQWDDAVGGWLRTQDGAPHLTAAGDQLAPENVVILVTDYGISAADPISPEVRSTGSGPLVVLTDGRIITGTWERPTASDKPELTDDRGEPIGLTPGQTWVLMPEEGQVSYAPGQELDVPGGGPTPSPEVRP